MKLIIAEKPELARNIARAVCGAKDGVRLPYRGGGYIICACRGHLLDLKEPAEIDEALWGLPWREDVLPICPDPWPKKVGKGKEGLFRHIEDALKACDEVVHAGDPDDEGQLIVDELLDFLGYAGPVRRVLVNDNIDKNIRLAFERARDNEGFRGAGRAANARAIADKAFGVSESRLATLRAGRGTMLSVGRVQTPALGLVVRRDEEIAGHVAQTYYTVTATGSVGGGEALKFTLAPKAELLDGDKRLSDKGVAESCRAECEVARGACETKVERKRDAPPLPYNLTELTADMSRRHKMSAKRVMDATQGLRDDFRAITYNRSDCPYLPTEAFGAARDTLRVAAANIGKSWPLDFSRMPRCFDDSKIDAHTGIIPQEQPVETARMSADQRKVYEAIVERYAMQFAGDEVFETSTTTLGVGCGELVHKARRQLEPGWRRVCDDGKADKGFEPGWLDAARGEAVMRGAACEEKKTRPKAPYTEGTLVKDMANAAKYVKDPLLKEALRRKDEGKPGEHGGIGTTATRSDIIEKLKARGYITEARGRLVSTKMGREFYHACPPEVSGVDTTARWWQIQERVAAGELDEGAVARDVCEVFENHRAGAWLGVSLSRDDAAKAVCKCPLCGADVVDRGEKAKKYSCSSNRWDKDDTGEWRLTAGCGFGLWKACFGKKLTAAQVRALCEKGRTGTVKNLRGKNGKTFEAALVLEDPKTGKIVAEFAKFPSSGSNKNTRNTRA